MNLLKEVSDDVDGVDPEKESPAEIGPTTPDGWSIGHLGSHGMILSCDGFQLKLDMNQLHKFFDIAESGSPGEIKDQNGKLILIEPTSDSIVMTRTGDQVYPNGVVLDLKTLKELGVEQDETEDQDDEDENDDTMDTVAEGVKRAWRRSGNKIKTGFRVTSGARKGRVVADIATAFKPRIKASTRMKLSIAGKKHKVVRVLKSRRTRKKPISQRLRRMNEAKSVVQLNISEIKRPNGAIGTQGVSATQVREVLTRIAKMQIPADMTMRGMVDKFKEDTQAIQRVRDFMKANPLEGYELPDGTIQITDGHHRVFLLDQAGDKTVPAEIKDYTGPSK